MKKYIFALFALLIIVAILEACFFLFTLTPFGKAYMRERIPTYSLARVLGKVQSFWADSNVHFGVWHGPNAKYHHKSSCFNVEYVSNSYGARDRERAKTAAGERVVVLGDSYVEGWGVEAGSRWTNILEKQAGVEFLNFGSSFEFGTTQYYLLYKHLAKKFSHSRVLVGILPRNDFNDNDFKYGKTKFNKRYRPYFVGAYPNYELIYFQDNLTKGLGKYRKKRSDFKYNFKIFLREFFYSFRLYEEIKRRLKSKKEKKPPKKNKSFRLNAVSKFYAFTKEEFDLMKFTLERIVEEADGKDVTVLLLPSLEDLEDFDAYHELGEAPLSRDLKKLGRAIGFQVIDLLPLMRDHNPEWKQYHLVCDGHWNEYGHEVAAKFISDAFNSR